jgi:hypothetical protein
MGHVPATVSVPWNTLRTMVWQRLSVRSGRATAGVLVEGVPDYLQHALIEWLRTEFGWHRTSVQGGVNQAFLQTLATATRIPVKASYEIGGISDQITASIQRDEDLFLDVLDATLYLKDGRADSHGLRNILEIGASAWTVDSNDRGLQKRVEEAAQASYALAVSGSDAVSAELGEAWQSVFGRNPDPSDAWDHAIKAVEELLIPLVLPGVAKPNLGGVAGELRAASIKWHLEIASSSTTLDDGRTVEAMIRLIWPNPDRHGGGNARRAPSQAEAERVVHLAVAIVQLCRDGGLRKA